MQISKELQTAIDAAKTGGKVALEYFQTELEIKKKHDNSILTIADPKAEDAIKKEILKTYPEAKFLAEESGGSRDEDDFWIIDPIDGTRVFAKGISQWSILIAHYYKGEITVGVSYTPTQNMLLVAEKDKGAFLNGKRVSVSSTTDPANSFGSFGSINRFKDKNPILKLVDAGVTLRSYEHAYAIALLVSGRMDVVIDAYAMTWDYAPFICIVKEAGGKVTDFQGKKWDFSSKNLLVTNGILHNEFVKIINS